MTAGLAPYAVAIAAIFLLAAAFSVSGLVQRFRLCIALMSNAARVLRDPALDDDTKERTARRSALILLAQFGIITAVSVAVFAIPAAAVWLADLVGFATMGAVWKTLFEPRLITGAALFFFVLVWIQRR